MCPVISQHAKSTSQKRLGAICNLFACWNLLLGGASAQTWDDAQGNPRWSKSQNWMGRQAPSNDGLADVFFGFGIHPDIELDSPWSIHSLTFLPDSGAYRFYGNALTLQAGGITNLGAPTQFFTNTLALGQSQTWNQTGGDITSFGTVSLGSSTLTVDGSHNLSLFGSVTGPGSVLKKGSGVLSLSGTNTFSGGIIATQGVLEFGNNRAAGSGDIRLNNATLRASINGLTLTNRFFLAGSATVAGNNSVTLSGNVVFTADQTLTVLNSGLTKFTGQIVEQGGAFSFLKQGSGDLEFAGSSSYSGGTTIDAGTLTLSGNNALGNTSFLRVNPGATLSLSGTDPINRVRDGASFSLNGGTLLGNSHTESFGLLTLEQNSTVALSPGGLPGTLSFSGGSRTAGTLTITGWMGSSAGATDDRILFGTAPSGDFLANVSFSGFAPGAAYLPSGEIVPVPEPRTVAMLALGLFGFSLRFFQRAARRRCTISCKRL